MNLDTNKAGLEAPRHLVTVNRRKARVPKRYAKEQRTADGICTGKKAIDLFLDGVLVRNGYGGLDVS